MGYYVETLNAGDTDRRAYKQADNIRKDSLKIMTNFDEATRKKLVKSIAEFDQTGHLPNNEQIVLLNNFGKVKDRPTKFIYVLLSWANDLGVAMTKKSLRGVYKKTFGHQLDYRYVRVVSNYFKLKFFKGKIKTIIEPAPQKNLQEELGDFDALLQKVTPTDKVITLLRQEQEEDSESQDWVVEQNDNDCVGENDKEVSIEPTENLDALLVKQKNTIKSLTDFIHSRGLTYEYLMSQQ